MDHAKNLADDVFCSRFCGYIPPALSSASVQCYRKERGNGGAVSQQPRVLRNARSEVDHCFDESSLLGVAVELSTNVLYVFMPSSHAPLAKAIEAEACDPPIFDGWLLKQMSTGYHPARPPIRRRQRDGQVVEKHVFDIAVTKDGNN
ncbi:hypothetical protein CWR53_22970 [Pseudomonas sp. SGAir0191]|uniref:hypothetical protein n=1 Tax=Pseudomonas sp. SGAir0191 TaxID=2217867 RepID=UPI0010FC4D16|nr:hypothetical protein [Pseudomonas sp. SGAir0191]QCU71460.1 hypothetical protein CWR53_22970 [Pseudomonas sp. SGAir0191]